MNEERFNNWTDVDNMKDHIRILEQRVDFMREKLEMLDKQDAPDGIEAVIDYIEAKLKEKNCAG